MIPNWGVIPPIFINIINTTKILQTLYPLFLLILLILRPGWREKYYKRLQTLKTTDIVRYLKKQPLLHSHNCLFQQQQPADDADDSQLGGYTPYFY